MKHIGLLGVGFLIMTVFGIRDISHLIDRSIRGYVAVAMAFVGVVGMLICGFLRQKQAESSTNQRQSMSVKPAEIVILAAIIAIIGGVMALLVSLR